LKWSDLTYSDSDFYIPYDENQKAIRGFWLTTLRIDLEKIPTIFHEPFRYYESNRTHNDTLKAQKVLLSDIVGTSYSDYGGMEIIESYMRIKRAHIYIKDGCVTRNKYFYMLKKPVCKQDVPVVLSHLENGKYYIDCSGNHRIILYKIMMLAEIAASYPYAGADYYDLNYRGFNDIRKKYWLNAVVRSVG
jgi:hypothetical protein